MSADRGVATDPLLAETVDRLLATASTFEVVEQAEVDGWCAPVWDPLAGAGFPWISVPESAGGSGGSLIDALEVVRAVGRHAAPVPLPETAVLGGWLVAAAGFTLPDGPITVVPDGRALRIVDGRLSGRATVPWARRAEEVLALVEHPDAALVASMRPEQLRIEPRSNMAGEPRDDVVVDLPVSAVRTGPAPPGVDASTLLERGALTRVVLAAGALATMSQMTVDYTNERRQFGRPVAAFQAVQQHLVHVAQCAVRASMAADVATRAFTADDDGDGAFEIAAARIVVDQAIVAATRAAHQAHGAMGVAREYRLQQFSRRLWSWRHEYGSARSWRRVLGQRVASAGADALFPMVSR
jgi:acyl-CoA dehydrogenase